MAGDGAQELVPLERVETDLALCGHGRGPRHVAQERDLAEVVARTQRAHVLPSGGNVHLARLDDVEAVAVVTLVDDLRARIGADRDQARGELIDRARRQWLEEWHRAQERELVCGSDYVGVERGDSPPRQAGAQWEQRAGEDECPTNPD